MPKGNKTAFIFSRVKRKDAAGTWYLNPRVVMTEGRKSQNPTLGREGLEAWKDRVKAAALVAQAVNRWDYIENEPLQLDAWFFLPRPKSLPKSVEYPMTKPDLEKLVRAIMDEMEGVLYDNDSRFIDHYTHKRFADDSHPIGVDVTIGRIG